MYYFLLPNDFNLTKYTSNKRVLYTINTEATFHCALMKKKEGNYFIYIGTKLVTQLKLNIGDDIQFELKKDTSEYQFHFPEELSEVLRTDQLAKDKFDSLTDGNKRGLIYLVNQVKSVDKKIERSLKIASQLRRGITSPRLILKK